MPLDDDLFAVAFIALNPVFGSDSSHVSPVFRKPMIRQAGSAEAFIDHLPLVDG
jgi:hypothetical protein